MQNPNLNKLQFLNEKSGKQLEYIQIRKSQRSQVRTRKTCLLNWMWVCVIFITLKCFTIHVFIWFHCKHIFALRLRFVFQELEKKGDVKSDEEDEEKGEKKNEEGEEEEIEGEYDDEELEEVKDFTNNILSPRLIKSSSTACWTSPQNLI